MRKNFLQSMKEIFRDWDLKVMSYVMLVVTATCVITATVAWFTCSVSAAIQNMEIKIGDTELIKLAVTSVEDDGEDSGKDVDVLREEGKNPEAVIDMPVFTNVVQSGGAQVLAPGVHGTVTLYVTALKQDVEKCEILPSFFGSDEEENGLVYVEGVTEDEQDILEELIQSHILFFKEYDEENGYSGLLTDDKPGTWELEWEDGKGIETEITIYWYWPYEYEDVPSEALTKLGEEAFLDSEKAKEGKYTNSRLYDYADTRIGTCVESVKFHFEVKAVYGSSKG